LRQQASLRLASAQGSLPDGARKAEATLKAVVEEDPTCAEAWFALGALYKRGGMHARAAALFRKVLAIEPRHEMAERELREFEGNSEPEPTKGRLIGRLFGSRR
jgi:tetratricopeptide (TPR) repeat protein